MNEGFSFFIIENDKAMRRIIAGLIREMVRSDEIPGDVEVYDASSGEDALNLFEIMFKTAAAMGLTYRDEPITPLPGRQAKAIAICNFEMEPMGGLELLRTCMDDEILRDINFVMMTEKPDLGLVSELGELGVINILIKPLTSEKFSHTVRNLTARIQSEELRHYKEVEGLLRLGEYTKALTLIKNAESKYTDLKWIVLRGRAHLGLNETQRAKHDFDSLRWGLTSPL